jgi:hypothetical protein
VEKMEKFFVFETAAEGVALRGDGAGEAGGGAGAGKGKAVEGEGGGDGGVGQGLTLVHLSAQLEPFLT